MRYAIAILTSALVLTACGGDDGAAKKAKIKKLEAQYQQLNGEMEAKFTAWQETRNLVIPARSAWLKSKGTDGEGEAKDEFDRINAAAMEASTLQDGLRIQIRDVKDKLTKLGWTQKSKPKK